MRRGLILAALVAQVAGLCPDGEAKCCHIHKSDPQYHDYAGNPIHEVASWGTVDLDLPPAQRWTSLVAPKAHGIRIMISTFKNFLGKYSRAAFKVLEFFQATATVTDSVLDAMPNGYGEEIRGIAKATGILPVDVLIYNIFYEIEGGCTSIVAQDANGELLHGRNLDFGLLFGEDWKHLQWTLTEALRPIVQNVRFVKSGRVVFNSTVFLGYVGAVTATKTGSFSVSVNTRYDFDWERGVRDWISGKDRTHQWVSFMTRDAMTNLATYDEALASIRSTPLVGAAYVIVGGSKAGEGAVVARNSTAVVQLRLLADATAVGDPFLVQANYDVPHDPVFDNRRVPGEYCLRQEGANATQFEGMFKVLSAHPNRNRLTTYTSLMSVQTGRFEAYLQYCSDWDCAPWMKASRQEASVVV